MMTIMKRIASPLFATLLRRLYKDDERGRPGSTGNERDSQEFLRHGYSCAKRRGDGRAVSSSPCCPVFSEACLKETSKYRLEHGPCRIPPVYLFVFLSAITPSLYTA